MKKIFTLFGILLLLSSNASWAQILFNDPNPNAQFPNYFIIDNKVIDNPGNPIMVGQGTTQALNFQVKVWRQAGVAVNGRFEFRYGDAAANLASPAIFSLAISNNSLNWVPEPSNSAYETTAISGYITISAAQVGTNVAIYAIYFDDSRGTAPSPSTATHPIYIKVNPTSTGGGTGISSFDITSFGNVGEVGTYTQFKIGGHNLNTAQSIVFNGQSLAFTAVAGTSTTNSLITTSFFTLPAKGDYNLEITSTTGAKASTIFHVVTPIITFLPCGTSGSPGICSSQCIPTNSTPSLLQGRVIATSSPDYDDYNNSYYWIHNASNDGQFGSPNEREQVQWQYSFDNINWSDIGGATQRNYQPVAITQTTYYRRVSTHIEGNLGHRANWYISETVTVSAQAVAPTLVQSVYTTCGNGNTTVGIRPSKNAVNYNWWVPYAGWTVSNDGTNPFSTYYNNSSFVTSNTQVVITIPNNAAPGDYQIAASANGVCGPKSADVIFTIRIASGSAPVGAIGDYTKVRIGNGDNAVYNLAIPAVTNATSYSAQISGSYSVSGAYNGSQVVFSTELPCSYYGQITVTATSACNSTSKVFTVKTPYCVNSNARVINSVSSLDLYPNPATEQVAIGSVEQESVALFYDAQGILRKQVTLHAQDGQTSISTQDLPTGLYHVSIKANSKILLTKQLLVQH